MPHPQAAESRFVRAPARPPVRRRLGLRWLGRVPYGEALALQERLLESRLRDEVGDTLLLLEHEHVYTLGRRADEEDLMGAHERLGVPVFRVGRGGGVTYHGPGQLVAYPIVALAHAGRDVNRYIRSLERALIATCACWGVEAHAPEHATGVWVDEAKIASVGIGVRRWVAWHGIALNVAPDLDYFRQIVACRMPALRVTDLRERTGVTLEVRAVGDAFARCLARVLEYDRVENEEVL